MLLRRVFMIALVAASAAAPAVSAKNLRADDGPAEYPPQSYTANQYVDSRGCVYIRAGYAGQVTWVPRVTRERKVLCGFKPSLAQEKAAKPENKLAAKPAAPAAKAEKAPAPAMDAQPAARVAATPKTPRKATASVGKPVATVAVKKTPPKAAAAGPAPAKPAKTAAKKAARATAPRQVAGKRETACPGASKISRRYINDGSAGAVRCGPQAEAPAGRRAGNPAPQQAAPRRVVTAPASTAAAPVTVPRQVVRPAPVKIPAGYEPAWKDDRLNPMRAKGTAEGKAQMGLVWTETVPRRLVGGTTGRASTSSDPKPRISASTKSVRVAGPKAPQAASHRFVQVGSFGVPANAQATKARLRALGLPVAVAKTRSKGRDLEIVFAGPFESQAQLTSALGAVRKAGYGDAFLRK
ncbi:MAG: SPOR domain-containing protein [Paracoccaceae bacterium]